VRYVYFDKAGPFIVGMFSVNRLTGYRLTEKNFGFPINRTETDKMAAKMAAGSWRRAPSLQSSKYCANRGLSLSLI